MSDTPSHGSSADEQPNPEQPSSRSADSTAPGRAGEDGSRPGFAARVFISMVRGYQRYLSGLKAGSTCRFEPTCSAYALDAFSTHGALKGFLLSTVRLCKCGPWHPGGYDPVPPRSRGGSNEGHS